VLFSFHCTANTGRKAVAFDGSHPGIAGHSVAEQWAASEEAQKAERRMVYGRNYERQ
jgi:hypothetical protein